MYNNNVVNHKVISQAIKEGLLPKNFSSGKLSKIISSGKLPKNLQQTSKSIFFMGGGMTQIILAFVLGAIGIGYFVYGKKQHLIIAMLAGVALNVISFFVSSIFLLILIGIVIMVIPWFLRF